MRSVFHKFTESLENHFRFDARYFLSSGFWLFLTQAGIVVTSLMVAVIFANILTETQYGYYRYIVELAAILTFFSLTGMGQTVLQATAKGYLSFFKQSIQWTLFYGFGITITASLCAAYYFYKDNEFLAIGCLLIAAFQPTTLRLMSDLD